MSLLPYVSKAALLWAILLHIFCLQPPSMSTVEPKNANDFTTCNFPPSISKSSHSAVVIIFVLLMFRYRPAFLLASLTLFNIVVSPSLLFASKVVSSAILHT